MGPELDPLGHPRCNWVRNRTQRNKHTRDSSENNNRRMKTSVKGKDSFASVTETDGRWHSLAAAVLLRQCRCCYSNHKSYDRKVGEVDKEKEKG